MRDQFIVIPVVNEARTIVGVVAGARRHGRVLVVDDGSTDRTVAEARTAGAEVLELGRRGGKGAALRAGIDMAKRYGADRVLTLDGDGQHDPADVPLLVEAARRAPGAIVVGGRLRNPTGMPRARLNACRVAGFFIDWLTGSPIQDTQSGFRSYPVRLFDRAKLRRGGFVLETEVLVAAARAGCPIVEVDIGAAHRPVRPSRFHPLADGVAIGGYLAAHVIAQCLREASLACLDLVRAFSAERRRARHAEMAEAAAGFPGAPHLVGVAIGAVVARRVHGSVLGWWRHPRRRRMSLVLTAIGASPLLAALALVQPLLGRLGLDPVTRIVDRFYSQDRLAAAAERGASQGRLEWPATAGREMSRLEP